MIAKLHRSILVKQIAFLLAISTLFMSFRMRPTEDVILKAGTSISLETTSPIRSELVRAGQMIDLRVKADIMVDNKVVVAAGSLAKAQIVRAQPAKGLGKAGFIEVQLKSVTAVDGQEVPLSSGSIYEEGEDKQTLSIVLGVAVCILFLTMKGKNAEVPIGYQISSSVAYNATVKI